MATWGVEAEAGGGRRGGSTAGEREAWSVQPGVCACVCFNVCVYLVFPDERPQLPAMSPSLGPVVKVTGLRDAPPHSSTVVLKLNVTGRFKSRLVHLHHLPGVLHTGSTHSSDL